MKNVLLLAVVAVVVVGCTEKEYTAADVVMTYDKVVPTSQMRLFTNAGQTIDPKCDNGFLDREYSESTSSNSIFYNSKFIEIGDEYGKGQFTFYNTGRITYATNLTIAQKENDVTIMQSSVTNKIADDQIMTSDLFKYKYEVGGTTYRYHYVVRMDDHSLDLSLTYYKLVRYDQDGKRTFLAFGTVHNEINEAFVATLSPRDTLAVKSYVLKYSIKENE